ncbi:MAG: ABC transporter ATP-binding protein/permease [Oscillospiraceae bacterium]|nr:ABC transporter ATP-binding protein/permease [Oscillospiraceae bacterium]
MLKLFTLFTKKEWLLIVVAIAFTVLGVWIELEIPGYLREITNIVTMPETGSMDDIWRLGGMMLLLSFGSMAVIMIVAWIGAVVSSGHSLNIRNKIYKKINDFSTAEMNEFSVPSLITRTTNDVTAVNMFSLLAIMLLFRSPILAVWAIRRIVYVSPELSTVTAVTVGLMIVVVLFITILVVPRFIRIQKLTDKLNQDARENLSGIRVVHAYNAQEFEQDKFEKTNRALARDNLLVNRVMMIFMPFITLLFTGLTIGLYWVGSWLLSSGQVDNPPGFLGDLMAFVQYSSMIVGSFMMLTMLFVYLPSAIVSGRRINEILSKKNTIKDPKKGSNDNGNRDICFKGVNFGYPDAEENVLTDISLEIPHGKTVAFIGGTGSGKTSIIKVLTRLFDVKSGEVTIGNRCIKNIKQDELNSIIGYVPQTATVFSGTVKSNIAFGKVLKRNGEGELISHDVTDEEVVEALKTAEAWEFVKKLEGGIESEIAQAGKNLSGGQKQRLSIARTVVRKPDIFIFDDTFSALDYATDRKVRKNLKDRTAGSTVIIVAQRIGTIKEADIIYVVDKGTIAASGTHAELMKTSEIYKEIALSQLSKEELA